MKIPSFRSHRHRVMNKRGTKNGRVLWATLRKNLPAYVGRRRRTQHRSVAPRYFIDPEARGKRVWDLVLTTFVLYTTCVVPYRVCFQEEAKGGFAIFENSMDVAFFMDIVLNFITGLQLSSGEVTYEFRVIVRAYLRGWFVVDFFSTLPFEALAKLFGVGDNAPAALLSTKLLRGLKALRLFKLARIRRLGKVFNNLEDAVYTNQSLVSLAKLALTMLFIAHLVACIWFAVGNHSSTVSWIIDLSNDPTGTPHDPSSLQYTRSVYWAIVTMTTIGYGDIVARSNHERLLNIAVMAVGVSFFGYVIGTISTLVTNLDVAAARYEDRMTIVKEYIISRRVPKYMGNKIRCHFEYFYLNRSVFKERRILERLPSALRNEMIHHVHSKLVSSIKYFENCHESLISDIVMALRPFAVLKDEYVYVQHEIAAHVFFLLKGKLQLVKTLRHAKEDLRLASVATGDHFGELEVYDSDYGNGVRICSAVAKSYCELTFLSREDITKISSSWPEVLTHFRETAATSSKGMRRRMSGFGNLGVTPAAAVLCPDHTMADTVLKSSILTDKPNSSRGNRISPFMPSTELNTSTSHAAPLSIPEETEEQGSGRSCDAKENPILPPSYSTAEKFRSVEGERDRSNHAWMPANNCDDPPASHIVHPLTFPHSPMAVGRKATLEALPGSPTHKAIIGAFDSLEAPSGDKEPRRSVLKAREQEHEAQGQDLKMSIRVDEEGYEQPHSPQTQNSTPRAAPHPSQYLYAPSIEEDTAPETAPLPPFRGAAAALLQHPDETLDHRELMRQLTEQALPGAPVGGRRSLGGAADENELHEMIAKIRDSALEQPKRNFKSERVMLRGTYLFHPQETSIVTWQFFVGMGIMYSIIVVPLRLGFDYDAVGGWYALEFTIDGFFFVDILVNFRTAFFDDERRLIFEPRIIFWRYAKGWFLPDLISTVPIDELFHAILGGANESLRLMPTKLLRLFRIARLLKLARLIKLSRVFGRIRNTIQLSPSVERLLKLLAIMSIFCHWNACLFHAVMLASETSGFRSWCANSFFPNDPELIECANLVPLGDRYVAAVYWAFTTLTTVGYGDVKPSLQSQYELATVIILVVVNATVFGYIISSVITLIRNLDPSDREYRLLMTEMKDYLRDSTVSARLCANVKMHYQHHIACTSLFPEQKIFDNMSPSLRFDVARLVAGETLFAIPLITVMEDSFKGFVSYALFLMKPVCIQRGEKVCRSGGPGTETFFLVEGDCDLVNSETGIGRIIGENAVFEQYALMAAPDEIYRTVSTATALSAKCVLYSLAIQDFKTLEDVSPAVSTYFLSQLASVLVADGMFTLRAEQKINVQHALRRGQSFRAVAEHNSGRAKLKDIGKVAMAKLYPRRGSEWSPDLLPKQLQLLAEKDKANSAGASSPKDKTSNATSISATVNAIVNQASAKPGVAAPSLLSTTVGASADSSDVADSSLPTSTSAEAERSDSQDRIASRRTYLRA